MRSALIPTSPKPKVSRPAPVCLTGTVARTAPTAQAMEVNPPCPSCNGTSEIVVVDLVVHATTLRCRSCGRRWTAAN